MASKNIVAHINIKKYIFEFTVHSGNIYKKTTPFIVDGLIKDGTSLVIGADADTLTNGQYFFDPASLTLYVYDASISDSEFLVTYRLLFSTGPVSLAWDLSDDGVIYEYLPRLRVSNAFNIKIDASATGTALIGTGSIDLENTDGFFNQWVGYFWEKQSAKLYDVSNGTQLIYDGTILSKDVSNDKINIKIQNNLSIVNKSIESTTITINDYLAESIAESSLGVYKNRIWGRVDGVKAQTITANPDIIELSGTVTAVGGSASLTGSGTSFLEEISSGDAIILGDDRYDVVDVVSDTSLVIAENATGAYSGYADVEYNVINPTFNRVWNISSRQLRETSVDIVGQSASTIYEVEDISDLEIGDNILLNLSGTYYLRAIESIFAKNIVINQSTPASFTSGDYVIRMPIQKCYYNKREINVHPSIVEVINLSLFEGVLIKLARNFEYYAGMQRYIDASGNWTGSIGQNYITRSSVNESLTENLLPRNYIVTGGMAYEIASVTEDKIRFTTNLASAVSQDGLWIVEVSTLTLDSTISCDVIGETEDGQKDGIWIKTGIQFLKQQLIEAGLEDNISTNFDVVSLQNNQLISLIAPISHSQKNMPKLKTLVDQLNKSLGGALFVNNDFQFDYKILDFSFDFSSDPLFIEEYDLISWASKEERNDLLLSANYSYRPKQIDPLTEESAVLIYSNDNELGRLLGHNITLDFDSCFYNLLDTRCAANRQLFLSTLLNTTITLNTDLRFSDINILDIVEIKLNNFSQVIQGYPNRYMLVLEIRRSLNGITLVLGDVGSSLNRRALIVSNDSNDYSGASDSEVLRSSYITDDLGLVDGEETKNFNLII